MLEVLCFVDSLGCEGIKVFKRCGRSMRRCDDWWFWILKTFEM